MKMKPNTDPRRVRTIVEDLANKSGALHVFSNVPHPIFVGNPKPLPPEWIRRDFAWSLLLACPPDPSGAAGRCNP
jgi:hypothetical protein